jgi:hypothetical protein
MLRELTRAAAVHQPLTFRFGTLCRFADDIYGDLFRTRLYSLHHPEKKRRSPNVKIIILREEEENETYCAHS